MSTARAEELERFKSEISLAEFAQSLGYEILKKESSRNCLIMQRGGDKVVVATDARDGHGIYFSVHDDADNGSVIDFAQKRLGGNLGQIRKELRGWCHAPVKPSFKRRPEAERPVKPLPVERDRAQLLCRWAGMTEYRCDYLTEQRGLDAGLVARWGVRQDERGNAIFAHFDSKGLCGWEAKNKGYTGFSAGGTRGLGYVRLDDATVHRLVVCEASVDAMSWAEINGKPAGTAYLSLGGALSSEQVVLIQRALVSTGAVELVLATDADPAGEDMAAKIAQIVPSGIKVVRDKPTHGKDWNDALQASHAKRRSAVPSPGRR